VATPCDDGGSTVVGAREARADDATAG